MKKHQIDKINFKKHNFDTITSVVKSLFGKNLSAIFVHGSLFDGTFGKYSDYDIVVILKAVSKSVLVRDSFAQKLKLKLINIWEKNPCSFDFYSVSDFKKSAKTGHPFAKSILKKGCPIYDPNGIFAFCCDSLSDQMVSKTKKQMAENLVFLADQYIEVAEVLLSNKKFQFALLNASSAVTFIMRSCLVLEGNNIYQGEIYQFFLKIFNKIPKNLANSIWKYAFRSNQISCRLKEPHIDIPLQNFNQLFKEMANKKLVEKMIELYCELKKFKHSLD